EREGGFPLTLRNAGDRSAQNFGLIGRRIQGESEEGAIPRVAEEPPEADCFQLGPERTQSIIDEESLRQQRRAAKEVDIAIAESASEAVFGISPQRDRDGQDCAQRHRDKDELDCYPEAG